MLGSSGLLHPLHLLLLSRSVMLLLQLLNNMKRRNLVKEREQSIFDGNLKEAVQNQFKVDLEAFNQKFLERSEESFTF